MKKILTILLCLVSLNVLAQENARRLTTIYSGCGYVSSVLEFQEGSNIFMLRFNDTLSSLGYDLKEGTAQDVYNVLKLFGNFVSQHEKDYDYMEDVGDFTLMIAEKRYSMMPTMLRVTLNGRSHEVDVKCVKKGKKEFEKYCKKTGIALE